MRIVNYALMAFLMMVVASGATANIAGNTSFAIGKVTATESDGDQRFLRRGSDFFNGDTVDTGRGRAQLAFLDGNFVSLQPATIFRVDDYQYDPAQSGNDSVVFEVVKGGLRMVTGAIGKRSPEAVQVKTPIATIGIRGTGFTLRICNGDCFTKDGEKIPDGLYVYVTEGIIIVKNDKGSLEAPARRGVYVKNADSFPLFTPVYPLTLPASMVAGGKNTQATETDMQSPPDEYDEKKAGLQSMTPDTLPLEIAQISGNPDSTVVFMEIQSYGTTIMTDYPRDAAPVYQAGEQVGTGGVTTAVPVGNINLNLIFP